MLQTISQQLAQIEPVAQLRLSGEEVSVAVDTTDGENSIAITLGGIEEPIFMSVPEADLLIAAIQAAKSHF